VHAHTKLQHSASFQLARRHRLKPYSPLQYSISQNVSRAANLMHSIFQTYGIAHGNLYFWVTFTHTCYAGFRSDGPASHRDAGSCQSQRNRRCFPIFALDKAAETTCSSKGSTFNDIRSDFFPAKRPSRGCRPFRLRLKHLVGGQEAPPGDSISITRTTTRYSH
jgi:hypothetical protein